MCITLGGFPVVVPTSLARIILTVALCVFFSPGLAFSQGKKTYTLAILDLVPNGISQVEAIGISDKLRVHISRLTKSPAYIKNKGKDWYAVVERTQMDKILDQFKVQNTGCVSDSCAIEFGKMLQADRIVVGTISLVGKTYSVTSRIVDIETGKALAEADRQYKGSIDNVLNKVIVQVGDELIVGKRKTHKTLYMVAGAIVAGGSAYYFSQPPEKKPPGTLVFDAPNKPDEP